MTNIELPFKTYVINMKKSKDRLKNMEKQIPKLGKQFTRISAIDGSKLSKKQLKKYTTQFCRYFCSKSMIGCFLSHKKTWQTIIKNNDKYALVLEDDCYLLPEFQKELSLAIKELNFIDDKWDFLYAGYFGPSSTDKPSTVMYTLQSLFLNKIPQKPHDAVHTYVPLSPVGFHCYVVSKKGAKKLLKNLNKASYHVDVEFLKIADKFNVYATKKQLGLQFSTTENSTLNEYKFPKIINNVLDKIKDHDGISYSYYFGSPLLTLSCFPINLYLILFILIAVASSKSKRLHNFAFLFLLAFLILEISIDYKSIHIIMTYIILLICIFFGHTLN